METYNTVCADVAIYDTAGMITPPSIITIMINIALHPGDLNGQNPLYGGGDDGMSPDTMQGIQKYIILVAAICIPWMLIPKPCIEIRHMSKPVDL